MLRSVKLKIALFSACTSGAILIAFALLFISMIHRIGLERIDRQLHAVTEAQLRRPGPPERWARFDASLAAMYGEERPRQFLVRVFGRNGEPVYTSPRWPPSLNVEDLGIPAYLDDCCRVEPRPPLPPFRPMRPGDEPPPRQFCLKRPRFVTRPIDGRRWRILILGNDAQTLIVGTDLSDFLAELQRHWNTFAVACPVALLLLASGGWLLARQALRPVQLLTHVARNITAKGLDQRVQIAGADQEFQSLIRVINDMLNRLDVSFRQAARFSADAAHELKTPLTILQGQLEQAVQHAPAESQEQRTYAGLLDEVQRLKAIVRKLLLLAQSDSGQMRLSLKAIHLNRELEALFEDLPLLAPGLTLSRNLEPDVHVMADPDLLRQVLQNIFSNAFKYNHEHGTLDCLLRREGGLAHLIVSNTTVPGAQIERERLFDRFYRGDAAHSRNVDGTGLGLSLAREISRAHGGDLILEASQEGWVSFRLSLPLADPATVETPSRPV